MTLILGIYSRKKNADKAFYMPVLADFSAGRKIDMIEHDRFLIAGYSGNPSEKIITEPADKNLIAGISGNTDIPGKNLSDKISKIYSNHSGSIISNPDGSYSLIIYDTLRDKLVVSNDPFGLYPLFWFADDDCIIFCNEYQPIIKYPKFKKDTDEIAIAEYFYAGAPLGDKTFFKNIKNLGPSGMLKIEHNNISITNYNREKPGINRKKKTDDFAADFSELFRGSTSGCLNNSEPARCSLTGGIDTRLILSAIPLGKRAETTFFSLLTPPLTEDSDRDVAIAKIIAEKCSLHLQIEPLEFWTTIWSENFSKDFFITERQRNRGSVITGYYGSELVKGEFMQIIPSDIRNKINEDKGILSKLKGYFSDSKQQQISKDYFSSRFTELLHVAKQNLGTELNNADCDNKFLLFSIHYMTRGFFTSMYSGSFGSWLTPYRFPLEMQMPFISTSLLNFYLTIPLETLLNQQEKLYHSIYKNNFPELIHIPTSSFFGQIKGNCIPAYTKGYEPKNEKKPLYKNAFTDIIKDGPISENIFDLKKIHTFTNHENHPGIRQFIEFETWLRYINT